MPAELVVEKRPTPDDQAVADLWDVDAGLNNAYQGRDFPIRPA